MNISDGEVWFLTVLALIDIFILKTLYVSSSRIICAKNGKFEKCDSSAVAYAWFEFQKGFNGDPVIKWIN